MNKIGCISYVNTSPFFYAWGNKFPLVYGTPRDLADRAFKGEILAGPLPLVECWNLEPDFQLFKNWGIAVREASQSVFLLSSRPLSDLHNQTISLTQESSTSVKLLQILIEEKYGHHVFFRRGFTNNDEARLVIGDSALLYANPAYSHQWPFVTDLATEWWEWTKLPFVFAHWVVKNHTSPEEKEVLAQHVSDSLKLGLTSLDQISKERTAALNLPPELIFNYLKGFTYELGVEEERSMALFNRFLTKIDQPEALSKR